MTLLMAHDQLLNDDRDNSKENREGEDTLEKELLSRTVSPSMFKTTRNSEDTDPSSDASKTQHFAIPKHVGAAAAEALRVVPSVGDDFVATVIVPGNSYRAMSSSFCGRRETNMFARSRNKSQGGKAERRPLGMGFHPRLHSWTQG